MVPEGEQAAANYGRWSDPETDAAIAEMAGTADHDELREASYTLQRVVAEEVPFAPIYASYWFIDINASRWTGWPTPEDFEHVPSPVLGPSTTLTLLDLEPATS